MFFCLIKVCVKKYENSSAEIIDKKYLFLFVVINFFKSIFNNLLYLPSYIKCFLVISKIKKVKDKRGIIEIFENDEKFDFKIKRIFYIHSKISKI